jgi:nucleoid DNA-binding protein
MSDYRTLKEWVDANGNKVSINSVSTAQSIPAKLPVAGYKEKFKKLVDYHIKHVDKSVLSTELIKLNNFGFEYRERCGTL